MDILLPTPIRFQRAPSGCSPRLVRPDARIDVPASCTQELQSPGWNLHLERRLRAEITNDRRAVEDEDEIMADSDGGAREFTQISPSHDDAIPLLVDVS
jgi:hypothetical protein